MSYIDGFVLVVPEKNLDKYKTTALEAAKIWMDHGALSYKECVIEDGKPEGPEGDKGMRFKWFSELTQAKDDETVIFAYIRFNSREHRDRVNEKVMNDERMKEICPAAGGGEIPFDMRRMAYGGFETIIDL